MVTSWFLITIANVVKREHEFMTSTLELEELKVKLEKQLTLLDEERGDSVRRKQQLYAIRLLARLWINF